MLVTWPWPTRRPASSGPCWSRGAFIGLRPRPRKRAGAARAWGERKDGMAQRSARRDRDNQCAPPYLEYAAVIWDPVRELPYRPAAVRCRTRGRTDGSIRPRATTVLKFPLARKGASTDEVSPCPEGGVHRRCTDQGCGRSDPNPVLVQVMRT